MKLLLLSDPDMHVGRFYTCVCPGVGVEAQGQIRGLKSCSRIVGFANSCSWVTLFVRDEPTSSGTKASPCDRCGQKNSEGSGSLPRLVWLRKRRREGCPPGNMRWPGLPHGCRRHRNCPACLRTSTWKKACPFRSQLDSLITILP